MLWKQLVGSQVIQVGLEKGRKSYTTEHVLCLALGYLD